MLKKYKNTIKKPKYIIITITLFHVLNSPVLIKRKKYTYKSKYFF